jgi:hypothetical protein
MILGRPKGSKNKSKGETAPPPVASGTGGISDEQREVLFFQHLKYYEADLAAKKEADAEFKNSCKRARADLGDHAIEEFKLAIAFREQGSDEDAQAKIDRILRVAAYMNAPLGQQMALFGEGVQDRRTSNERAYAAGKLARLQGEPMRPPHDPSVPQHDQWIEGWHAGEKALNDAQRRDDELAFHPDPDASTIGGEAATFFVEA